MNTVIKFLVGTWFICSTNFPMWLKGDKTNPTFNYGIAGENKLTDNVTYLKKGKEKTIKGFDCQDEKDNNSFVWRGKGLLRPLKSRWKLALVDPNGHWAVIYFTKTLFTPEGVDIISRDKNLSPETIEQIKVEMLGNPELSRHVSSLKNLYH